MVYLKAFFGGFLSTLIFHQLTLLTIATLAHKPIKVYNMAPTAPFGVPSVISLAFFGGLWGAAIWWWLMNKGPQAQLIQSIVIGAIGPTLIAYVLVFPLKGMPVNWALFPVGLLVNGVWGLGLWVFMRLTARVG